MAILLFAIGIIILVAEVFLPTHGLLGLLGLICIGGAVMTCFHINQWLGLVVFLAVAIASPFSLALMIKLWPKTPVGKGMLLRPLPPSPARPIAVAQIGQVGWAITEMRPIGECEFGDLRTEAVSEYGIIAAREQVRVVALDQGRPVVRAVPVRETTPV
jgi:membrane-bound ClpP family serine protease